MIVIKGFLNRKKVKLNILFLTISFFIIHILFVSYLSFDSYIKTNDKEEYRIIQISKNDIEPEKQYKDIKENKNIIKYEVTENNEFILLVDKYSNLQKVEKFFLNKNYNVTIPGNNPNMQLYYIQNILATFIILFIIVMIILLFRYILSLLKEDHEECCLLFCLGYTLSRIKKFTILKIVLLVASSCLISLILSFIIIIVFNTTNMINISILVILRSIYYIVIIVFILFLITIIAVQKLKIPNKKPLQN